MLFIADQHHLWDLESKIVEKYGSEHAIRLIGDFSPSKLLLLDEDEPLTLLKKMQQAYKEEKGISPTQELTFSQKQAAHLEGIAKAFEKGIDSEDAVELIVFYGGVSISNLARKSFIHARSKEKAICLQGNEHLMHHAQQEIYREIISTGIAKDDVIKYIFKVINASNFTMADIILDLLESSSNIKSDLPAFIASELSTANYGGRVPTGLDVYKEHPHLSRFEFEEKIAVEQKDNCVIIHVPYFCEESERNEAIDFANARLVSFLNDSKKMPVIAYHGNPYPEGMGDEASRARVDYNKNVIESVVNAVCGAIPAEAQIICSHLHKSNPSYLWPFQKKKINLIPLGITDFALLDTSSGNIEVRSYS